jgi:hypothetical protein
MHSTKHVYITLFAIYWYALGVLTYGDKVSVLSCQSMVSIHDVAN